MTNRTQASVENVQAAAASTTTDEVNSCEMYIQLASCGRAIVQPFAKHNNSAEFDLLGESNFRQGLGNTSSEAWVDQRERSSVKPLQINAVHSQCAV